MIWESINDIGLKEKLPLLLDLSRSDFSMMYCPLVNIHDIILDVLVIFRAQPHRCHGNGKVQLPHIPRIANHYNYNYN